MPFMISSVIYLVLSAMFAFICLNIQCILGKYQRTAGTDFRPSANGSAGTEADAADGLYRADWLQPATQAVHLIACLLYTSRCV